jgi:Swt1-like HEPN
VQELRDVRNRWAHQEAFLGDDAYCALDSVHQVMLGRVEVEVGAHADLLV